MTAPPPEDPSARLTACHDLADDLELEFVQPGLQRQLELIKRKAEEVGPEKWPLALLTMPAAESEPIWDAMRVRRVTPKCRCHVTTDSHGYTSSQTVPCDA